MAVISSKLAIAAAHNRFRSMAHAERTQYTSILTGVSSLLMPSKAPLSSPRPIPVQGWLVSKNPAKAVFISTVDLSTLS